MPAKARRIAVRQGGVAVAPMSRQSAHAVHRGREGRRRRKVGNPRSRKRSFVEQKERRGRAIRPLPVVKFLGVISADNCKAILCIELLGSDERSVGW